MTATAMTRTQAIILAATAHDGQVDKTGRPYVDHVLAVMLAVDSNDEDVRMAAVLHDIVEDTGVTLDDLREKGCPDRVVEAVDALTRRHREAPEHYYLRVAADPVAVLVKLADIAHNSDPARLAQLPQADRERLTAKYAKSRRLLGMDERPAIDSAGGNPPARGAVR